MSFTFIFPDEIHFAVGHCREENVLEVLWSLGNPGGAAETDIDEAIRAAIDEFFHFLEQSE